jgi:5-methylcytosine-specific restriction endonuclease McrA
MKPCSKCKLVKALSEFYVKDKSGRLHAQCKACYKKRRKTYYSEHYKRYGDAYRSRARLRHRVQKKALLEVMLKYLEGKSCAKCGITDIRTFEFDHLDPLKKKFSIARGISNKYSWSVILAEIEKCQILCANCHKIRTAQQFKWYKTF